MASHNGGQVIQVTYQEVNDEVDDECADEREEKNDIRSHEWVFGSITEGKWLHINLFVAAGAPSSGPRLECSILLGTIVDLRSLPARRNLIDLPQT